MENLSYWIMGMRCLMALLFGVIFLRVGLKHRIQQKVLVAYHAVCMQVKESKGLQLNFKKCQAYLKSHGAAYHYGNWMNPLTYWLLCVLLAGVGLILGVGFGLLATLVFGTLGAFLPGILLEWMNKKDNEEMLPELKMIYAALAIQIRAGVYVTDALAECYTCVKQKRVRDALLVLSADIVMKSDLDEAFERFQSAFSNVYVDTLCITLLQAMESGQAIELLGDIGEQMKDTESLLQAKKKEQLNRSAVFYQLGIFAVIMALVLFASATHLLEVAGTVFM